MTPRRPSQSAFPDIIGRPRADFSSASVFTAVDSTSDVKGWGIEHKGTVKQQLNTNVIQEGRAIGTSFLSNNENLFPYVSDAETCGRGRGSENILISQQRRILREEDWKG